MAFPNPSRRAPVQSAPSLDLPPVVLLADDERSLLLLVREALEDEHFRVLTAPNGVEALTVAETSVPDILVTDVAMPGLDGFGLVRAVRRLYPDLPVIVITGDASFGGRPVEEVAAEHGVDAVLMKPFDLIELQQTVRAVVLPLGAAANGDEAGRAA